MPKSMPITGPSICFSGCAAALAVALAVASSAASTTTFHMADSLCLLRDFALGQNGFMETRQAGDLHKENV